MIRRSLYILLGLTILSAGCEKIDLNEPVDGSPVFFIEMTVNGMEKSLEAGIDDYYMFTDYTLDPEDVYVLSGKMQKDSCLANVCGESIEILIRGDQPGLQGGIDPQVALAAGFYEFGTSSASDTVYTYDTTYTYRVEFTNQSTYASPAAGMAYWEFGDSTVSFEHSPVHFYDELDPAPEVTLYAIDLTGGDSCLSSQVQRIRMPGDALCSVAINPQFGFNDSTLTLETIVEGSTPFTYSWNNGSTSPLLQEFFQPNLEYAVTVSDNAGCTASASFTTGSFLIPGVSQGCSASFAYVAEREILSIDSIPVSVNDPLQLSHVTILYTDEAGITYSSARQIQTAASFFEIVESEGYDENEKGDATRKLELAFRCRLSSSNGDVVEITADRVVWAVAYPGQ